VKSKVGGIPKKGEVFKCKKCGYDLHETKMLSMSTRNHDYGRQTRDEADSGYYGSRLNDYDIVTQSTSNLDIESDETSEEESDSDESS